VVLSIDTYRGENENAHNRILWVIYGVEDAIRKNQDGEERDEGWLVSMHEHASRLGECKRVGNRCWNAKSMSEDACRERMYGDRIGTNANAEVCCMIRMNSKH